MRRHFHLRLLPLLWSLCLLLPRPIRIQPRHARPLTLQLADCDQHHESGHGTYCCCALWEYRYQSRLHRSSPRTLQRPSLDQHKRKMALGCPRAPLLGHRFCNLCRHPAILVHLRSRGRSLHLAIHIHLPRYPRVWIPDSEGRYDEPGDL